LTVLYKNAREGTVSFFTGINSIYEIPDNPELIINTSELDINQSAVLVLNFLIEKGFIMGLK
jgi:adenylylsulfate kinase-like enzyme